MTDETREQIKQDAVAYGESFKTGEWFERLRIEAYTTGSENQHQIGVKEGYNMAIEDMISIYRSIIDFAIARRDEAMDELNEHLSIAMACTITNGQESIKKLEKLKKP